MRQQADATRRREGSAMRGWQGEAMQQPAGATRRREGRKRTTRGDVTTSWHDKTTPGWRHKRRHNLVVFRAFGSKHGIDWRGGSHGHARVERKPERLGVGDELQGSQRCGPQKGVRARSHRKDMRTKMAHPFVRVSRGPT